MANNDLGAELTAMQEIAEALQQLDQPTRARVLHWVVERFQGDAALMPASAPAPAATAAAADFTALTGLRAVPPPPTSSGDETLSVGTLTDFFNPRAAQPSEPAAQSISGMLHEFVAEFQDLAREWHDEDAPSGEARTNQAFPVAS